MKESLTNQAESCGELIQEQSNSAPLASKEQDWQLICPPRNWKDPLPIDLGELRLLEIVSQRINLVITRDDKRKKLYLGSLRDGMSVGSSLAPDGAKKLDQTSPPQEFGSGWIAKIVSDEEAGPEYRATDLTTPAPLISAFPDHQVSKNFRLSEFRPGDHSYKYIRLSPKLVSTLEDIRQRAGGRQLHITSGYRPPAYNRKVGGATKSLHMNGIAADITSDDLSTEDLYDICDRVIGDRGGVGYYPDLRFVHVDIRGYRARW